MRCFGIAGFCVAIDCAILGKSKLLSEGCQSFSVDYTDCPDIKIINNDKDKRYSISKEMLYSNFNCSNPTLVYKLDSGWYEIHFQKDNQLKGLVFLANDSWTEIILTEDHDCSDELIFGRVGALLNLCFLYRKACVFHGVCMDYQGNGILVMAESGVGKSTHTNMWEKKEHALIMNGDRCMCRCIDGEWFVYGLPWSGSSNKVINMSSPIKHIVMIGRDSYNHVEETSAFEAEVMLLQRLFGSVAFVELQDISFDVVHDIAQKVNIVKLFCLPDYDSVDVLKASLFNCNDQE